MKVVDISRPRHADPQNQNKMKNAINWFEIPVTDFDRAKKFYEIILGATMQTMEAMGMKSAFFPADLQNGIGGCIIQGPGYEPATKGSLVYLNGGEDLNSVLSKVEQAGGKIMLPKTAIGPNGFMAHFQDCEGNRVGLHSMK
jgi:uncharacterized protein